MHAWLAWLALACMRGWRACVACMRGVHAWRACVACMRGVHPLCALACSWRAHAPLTLPSHLHSMRWQAQLTGGRRNPREEWVVEQVRPREPMLGPLAQQAGEEVAERVRHRRRVRRLLLHDHRDERVDVVGVCGGRVRSCGLRGEWHARGWGDQTTERARRPEVVCMGSSRGARVQKGGVPT